MRRFPPVRVLVALRDLGYQQSPSYNPGELVLISPATQMKIVVPVNLGDDLSEAVLRQVLKDEPIDLDQFIQSI